jgi:sucrose-6-phosphate hydrolase SacC (GH32 family)
VFGLRHQGSDSGQTFQGAIEEARIYDRALTEAEIRELQPNQPSKTKPYAWWTFERSHETDLMGRFPVNCLTGGARIEGGRLILDHDGATLLALATLPGEKSTVTATTSGDELPAYRAFRNRLIADRTRPIYHLVAPEGRASPGDPNGALYWKGRYHLHFIFPGGWAHVSSADMVHWRWHPVTRVGSGGMNSGGCFLNKEGVPTLIYNDYGAGGKNVLAFASDDNLEQWSATYPIEPQVRPDQDGGKISVWDPDAWLEDGTYYALFGNHPYQIGREATLMKSTDLRRWEYVGPFLSREMPDVTRSSDKKFNEDISCPNFFRLGNEWMLLCISHVQGCRYYLGDWQGGQFSPRLHARMNWSRSEGMAEGAHGGEFFAPESLLTPDGRRVMWAWCFASSTNGGNALWDGLQSLPREISLPSDGVLRIKPLRELEHLRYQPAREQNLIVADGVPRRLVSLAGDAIEILAAVQPGATARCGMRVLCDQENRRGLDIIVEPATKRLKVGDTVAPFELRPGEDLRLRVFVDRRTVEVFANDRQAVVRQHDYEPGETGVCLLSEGGQTEFRELLGWRMASTQPW